MNSEREIGETGYLKKPYRGYRYFEIVGFDYATGKIEIEFSSGMQTTVYDDEIE